MKLTNRKFGVEIEFLRKSNQSDDVAFNAIVTAMTARGLNCRSTGYTHSTTPYWKILTDASCGLELVSPVLSGESGLREVEIACEVLNILGYKVDKNTGLHVHHDARDLSRDQITGVFATAMKWESVMDKLVAPSRVNNRFCESNTRYGTCHSAASLKRELAELRRTGAERYGQNNYNRYLKVNYQAYLRHGTIEFRQHQGTTESSKIIHWIILTQNIITKVVERGTSWSTGSESTICFKRFRDMLGCTGRYIEQNPYVLQAAATMIERYRKFSGTRDAYMSTL